MIKRAGSANLYHSGNDGDGDGDEDETYGDGVGMGTSCVRMGMLVHPYVSLLFLSLFMTN